jgi:cell division protein DivIC
MHLTSSIIAILKNKYLISVAAFAVIMLFLDHNNFFEQMQRKKELQDLQAKKKYYSEEIEKTKKELGDLSNNPATIEKYAREHFQMKRDNEDVFIVDSTVNTLKN